MSKSSNYSKQRSAATRKGNGLSLYPAPHTETRQTLPIMMGMCRKLAEALEQHCPKRLSSMTEVSYISAVQYANH